MSTIDDLDMWSRDLLSEERRDSAPSMKLWKLLVSEIKIHIAALNTQVERELVTIYNDEKDFLSIKFDRFELRLMIDSRWGTLRYAVFDPYLQRLDEKASQIVNSGHLELFGGSVKLADTIIGDRTFSNMGYWTVHEQLAAFLIQGLLVPQYVDDRFKQSTS